VIRRTFLRWVSAASIAASISLPQFGLQAKNLGPEPLQPNERVQKIILSPVLEELEKWNLARCEAGGVIHDFATLACGVPVYSQTTGRLLGYAPLKKPEERASSNVTPYRVGGAYRLRSRRELMFAWGGVDRGDS
jgi:hypothetical protein